MDWYLKVGGVRLFFFFGWVDSFNTFRMDRGPRWHPGYVGYIAPSGPRREIVTT